MKISILQFKPNFGNILENFKTVNKLINYLTLESPDIIVLPELWSTGFYPKPVLNFADHNGKEICDFLATLSNKHNVNIVGGTVIVQENDKIYNRSYIFNRTGKNVATYDKIHLFSMSKENEVFSAGYDVPIFEIDGVKSSIAVCYDIRFPELIRDVALNDIFILFLPAAWPLKRLEHWKILRRARAIENQIFIVAANSAGHSTIIDPWGEILAEAGPEEEIITVNINLNICKEVRNNMNVFADRRDHKIKIYK